MRQIEIEYDAHLDEMYPRIEKVRDLGDCTIWSAGEDPKLLILHDPMRKRLVQFEYTNLAEFERATRLVLAIDRDDGEATAGVPARLNPVTPIRSAEFEQPLPREDERARS